MEGDITDAPEDRRHARMLAWLSSDWSALTWTNTSWRTWPCMQPMGSAMQLRVGRESTSGALLHLLCCRSLLGWLCAAATADHQPRQIHHLPAQCQAILQMAQLLL